MNLIQLNQIIEGWGNLALDNFNLLNDELKKVSEDRFLICDGCPLRDGNRCSTDKEGEALTTFTYKATGEQRVQGIKYKGCGCNLHAKVLCKDCQCPLGKWLEYDNRNSEDL